MFSRKFSLLACALALAVCSLCVARAAAGGELAGTVTDQRGAVVIGATVTVTDAATNKTYTAVTDERGRYQVAVPPGRYRVSVAARGFNNAQSAPIGVEEGKTTTADVRLEVSVEPTTVLVTAAKDGATGDAVYQQLRQQASGAQEFAGPYATVSNVVLKRDAGTFTLKSGELYFAPPVEGRTVGAVFIGEGELTLTPPIDVERRSLAIFTKEPTLTEQFTQLILRFTDKTFDEVKQAAGVTMGAGGAQAARARDLYRDNQQLLRKELRSNADLRTLGDLYNPQQPGYFTAFINGRRFNKLVFRLDPLGNGQLSPEEVALFSYGESDGGVWTSFHFSDEYKSGTASSSEDNRLYDITQHTMDAAISGTTLTVTDQVSLRALVPGTRVLPFRLYPTLRVSSVTDEQGNPLAFIQEDKNEDSELGVILPRALAAGQAYKLIFQYKGGGALSDSGGGNFVLGPRSSWYPNNPGNQFGDLARFTITFHYPKSFTLIGTGAPTGPETTDADGKVAQWTSGETQLEVAGFNFGRFKKKEVADKASGLNIEFYANTELPDEIRQVQAQIEEQERQGVKTGTTLGAISTTQMADQSISEAKNSIFLYNTFFGKTPFTRIAMSQQPFSNFGQAWPTLVYMPYTAFFDVTQRVQLFGSRGGTDNFWRYVAPHEVAHQWWGHTVGWASYRDQWMSEGFAEFSASLYVQYVRHEPDKFVEFWEEQRRRITEATPATRDIRPYTIGPVTQGFRLSNAKTRAAYQLLVYPKGAYILHMIRMMMYDPRAQNGDEQFVAMMHDFIKTHYNQDVSTEDLKQMVEKHMTPQMNLGGDGRMDWFFDEYVYGTEMPSYKFEYQISGNTLSGRITQSGVSDNFRMLVPLYADFGNGWRKLGTIGIAGNMTRELPPVQLPAAPKRAAVAAYNDVLALSVENKKM